MKSVDAKTLREWMNKNEAVLVDVREPAEHAAENIEGAVLVPLAGVSTSSMPDTNGKKLVIHCRSGKRSANACQKLLTENPDLEIYNLEGGIMAWSGLGQEIKSSGKFFLPLDRQVQLSIGLILLLASIAGYMGVTSLFLVTGFIGCGLIIAGATGFCGLAMLMARMPWNQKSGNCCGCSK